MGRTERWGTRVGVVLAVAGSAVGLGNFLRFPAQAAQNGGGAFLIPYFVSFVVMGIPLLWVEWALGRRGGRSGKHSPPGIFDALGRQRWLKYFGALGLFANVGVAAYYCYIESWTLGYVWHSLARTFATQDPARFFPEYLGLTEPSIAAFPVQAFVFFAVTLALNTYILSRGLVRGIELTAKIGLPLLVLFAAVLAVRGLTVAPGDPGVVQSPWVGLDFVWRPQPSGLTDPSVWLAAAGQIFFTLSVGMGSIHCFASYLRERDDIALNAMTSGWINEFIEVVLGGSILIPIATAYLGLAAVQSATAGGSGFALAFLALPQLFENWGFFAPVAGALWFGLLFLAGITSSLAMGQPVMAFLQDELGWSRERSAVAFGAVVLALGSTCVWLYPGGAFDEFDFWTGTFALVVFALGESLIFVAIVGLEPGWEEINRGAELRIPRMFRFVLRYVTPLFLLGVLAGALIEPRGRAWGAALRSLFDGDGWPLAADSVAGRLLHLGDPGYRWIDDAGRVTPALVQDGTRLLLAAVLVACLLLVWWAWRRKPERG